MSYEEKLSEAYSRKLPDLAPTQPCKVCGGTRSLLPVNERFALYVHHGAELEKCKVVGWITSYMVEVGRVVSEKYRETHGLEAPKASDEP